MFFVDPMRSKRSNPLASARFRSHAGKRIVRSRPYFELYFGFAAFCIPKSMRRMEHFTKGPNEALEGSRLPVTNRAFSVLRTGTIRARQPSG